MTKRKHPLSRGERLLINEEKKQKKLSAREKEVRRKQEAEDEFRKKDQPRAVKGFSDGVPV